MLTGLTLWLRGDLGLHLAASDVTQWDDQSGNGNHLATDAGQFNPTTTTNINGQKTVSFVTGERCVFASFTAGLTALELFCVGKNADDGATGSGPFAFTDDSGGNNLIPFTNRQIFDNTGSTTRQTTGFAPSVGAWSSGWIYSVIATGGEWTASFNGTQVFTQASNTFGYSMRRVGQGTSAAFNGDMAELIICNAKQSAASRAACVAYLKARYGIA